MVTRMQKAVSPEKYLERAHETLTTANAIGLPHGIYIIFNYPGETPDTVRETQTFIESLDDDGPMITAYQVDFQQSGSIRQRENAW